jgi:hypothetical protein
MNESNKRTGLSPISKTFLINECIVTMLDHYLSEHPWALESNSLPKIHRINKGFIAGNNTDFRSYFDILIDRLVIGGMEYTPRKAATFLVDNLLDNNSMYKNEPIFREFEDEQRDKIGPYSIRLPFESFVERGPCEYFNIIDESLYTFDPDLLALALNKVSLLIPNGSLRPLSIDDAFDRSDKTTNWGAPYLLKGNDLVGQKLAATLYLDICRQDLTDQSMTWFPNIMFMRTQPSGTDIPKQRLAFGCPHSITLLESTLQVPLLEILKLRPEFSENLSQSAFNEYATNLFRECEGSQIPIIGFDASGYDKSICKTLIHAAYDMLKLWFISDCH